MILLNIFLLCILCVCCSLFCWLIICAFVVASLGTLSYRSIDNVLIFMTIIYIFIFDNQNGWNCVFSLFQLYILGPEEFY